MYSQDDNAGSGRRFAAPNLLQIAMPMGGLGAGCICLNGHGGLQDFSIRHRPEITAMPDGHGSSDAAFALLHVRADGMGHPSMTKLLEGPLPPGKVYDQGLQGQGYRKDGHEGLPRFADGNTFEARYPFGTIHLDDLGVPLTVRIVGWSPFVPRDDVASGLPCAVLEYTFENRSDAPIDFDFSFHLSHLAAPGGRWAETRNAVIGPAPGGAAGGGVLFTNTAPDGHEDQGSAALYLIGHTPKIKARWFSGGWFDGLSVLWREVSTGAFRENAETNAVGASGRNGGSLLIEGRLAPGESVSYPVVIAWHFPNCGLRVGAPALPVSEPECGPGCDCGTEGEALLQVAPLPLWSPFYAGVWNDAGAVAYYVAERLTELRSRTAAFADALHGSTLPAEALDAVASNLTILKSPTVLRQKNGNVWGWEGCFAQAGCCSGTCTHVWNYAQALPHLFPALERTLREQEWLRSMDERGHVNFRAALPDGPAGHGFHAAADGQLGGILKLFREYQVCGDRDWLARLYPAAKRSLDYCIGVWDPDRRGGLFEPHHNTYDIEFWGPAGMCGSIYVAALSALAWLARELGLGDAEAAPYEELAARGARLMDETLFNGEYYQQRVEWREAHDGSLRAQVARAGDNTNDEAIQLLTAEGPKYQYGDGCLSDGIIGGWMAAIYGIETPLSRANIRSTLAAIVRHNFRAELSDHACLQRPGYAVGREAGLLLCSWPRGGQLTLPFPYSDEVWTGIEYQVASHLIEEGMVSEGLTLVRAVRGRYDGYTRNPFNEYECGNYYARAMASYALLASLSGFRYSASDRTLRFGPRWTPGDSPFRCFFSTDSGFGTISLGADALTVTVIEGTLAVERLHLTRGGVTREYDWTITIRSGEATTKELETA